MLKIASWNVNSLNVRLPQVLAWSADAVPDVLALQETKLMDDRFPMDELAAMEFLYDKLKVTKTNQEFFDAMRSKA